MKTIAPSLDGSRFTASPALSAVLLPSPSSGLISKALASRFYSVLPEDSLVVDDRSAMTPAKMVEDKLVHRLKELSMPVSHLQMRGLVRNRFEA